MGGNDDMRVRTVYAVDAELASALGRPAIQHVVVERYVVEDVYRDGYIRAGSVTRCVSRTRVLADIRDVLVAYGQKKEE
jgi:hypothetical protein